MAIEINKIKTFLEGSDPQKRIVNIECGYGDTEVSIFSRNDLSEIVVNREEFFPFVWAKLKVTDMLIAHYGSRSALEWGLRTAKIWVDCLKTDNENGQSPKRMLDGYNVLFFATESMSYSKFTKFFRDCGIDIYGSEKNFMAITPVEQYMIKSGKRYFKELNEYDDLLRCIWDIETEGLDPNDCAITQIGISTNKGYEQVLHVEGNTKEEKEESERKTIQKFFQNIEHINPDILAGHNSEVFDWPFILRRIELLWPDKENIFDNIIKHFWGPNNKFNDGKYDRFTQLKDKKTKKEYTANRTLYKKDIKSVLKLGNEAEYFYPTIWYGHTVVDSLHACRRAQAIDSNMKSGSLKYAAEYAKQKKQNRVYIPGDKISDVYYDKSDFVLDESNGEWHKLKSNEELTETQKVVSGKYIADRYLLDDLYEGDRVEWYYNQSSFFLSKMLPIPYQKVLTMGTSATWKYILLAWSYENKLAVPALSELKPFTGGLSRLLKVGFVKDIVKLDFNSLYPAITLSFDVFPKLDISGVFKTLLGHILSERERFKGLKKEFGKKAKATDDPVEKLKFEQEEARNDKLQLPFKIFGNAFFGSYGAPNIFNWGDVTKAEQITCTARQCLRLMTKWFEDRGFRSVVMDSVTGDTPILIKYKYNNEIDIKQICDLFDENKCVDINNNGQFRDFSEKPYLVLTRNGWKDIEYVYKHKTNKKIHRIKTKDVLIDVTEDHSLFDKNKKEIQPKNIKIGDKIELYEKSLDYVFNNNGLNEDIAWLIGLFVGDGSCLCRKRPQKYFSKRKCNYNINYCFGCDWKIDNLNYEFLIKAQNILKNEYNINANIKDHIESSGVFCLRTSNSKLSRFFAENCYTNNRLKKIPSIILNSDLKIKKAFINGLLCADGYGYDIDKTISIGQKSKVVMAGIDLIFRELKVNYRILIRKDKPNFITFSIKNRHGNNINDNYSKQKSEEVFRNDILFNEYNDYVYDISLDGTFINALGMNVLHNTDGINFSYSDVNVDYTYTGNGLSRNTKEGKEYHGIEAYVAEFNDLFMREKMGLGIDEYASNTINFSRKNYADLLDNGKVKYVGNSIKSKKMPKYIEKFLETNILLLLNDDGYTFLKNYNEYINKIYNYQIPLRDIASIGSIKVSLKEYQKNSSGKNKAGGDKAKQAWYELALQHNIQVHPGDKIHYVNIGVKKSEGDVIKEDIYEYDVDGNIVMVDKVDKKTGEIVYAKRGECKPLQSKKVIGYKPRLNCVRIDPTIIESDIDYYGHEDIFGDNPIQYNAAKYISQFNSRIKALLVCFHPDIRDKILVETPDKANYFTEEQSKLTSGFPNKEIDQDTLEALLTMEDKEIKFWTQNNLEPPFVNEIGIDWEAVKRDYYQRQEELRSCVKEESDKYNNIIERITEDDIKEFNESGGIVDKLWFFNEILEFCKISIDLDFISKLHNVKLGTLSDITEKQFYESDGDDENESTGTTDVNNEYACYQYMNDEDYGKMPLIL